MQQEQGRFRVATLAFILGALVYILFMVLLRYDLRPSVFIFWASAVLMVAAIVYHIFKCPNSEKFILLEIFLFTLLIHLESVLPYQAGVIGDDFPLYYYAIEAVMEHGIPIPVDVSASPPISDIYHGIRIPPLAWYPAMIFTTGFTSTISGVDLIATSRWLPSLWSSFAPILVFLFSRSIYNDSRPALLAALGVSTVARYITTHSQLFRESMAFIILLFLVYMLYAAYRKDRGNLKIIVILFAITLVLTHYFVSIIWIILLVVIIVWLKLIDYLTEKRRLPSVSPGQAMLGIGILSGTLAFTHWMYMEIEVLPTIANQFRNLIRYGEPTLTSPTQYSALKDMITSSGVWFFLVSFAIIILWEVSKGIRGRCN